MYGSNFRVRENENKALWRIEMELGSEFNLSLSELTVKGNNIFTFLSEYNNVIYFDSGRSALRHL